MTAPTPASPAVHAVVVNYNGWEDTVECVTSLLESDYPLLRIVVLDNGSCDGSLERLSAWARGVAGLRVATASRADLDNGRIAADARLLLVDCGANLGFAGANNVALAHVLRSDPDASALLLNNDAIIAPTALRQMVALGLAAPEVGAVGATVLRRDRPEVVEMLAGATVSRTTGMVQPVGAGLPRRAPRPETPRMDYVSGCCLLVSMAAVRRVGLMDERYFLYSEDVDWGIRMRGAGLRLGFCPGAEVWHKGGASVRHRSAMHDYYMVRAALLLVKKHHASRLPLAMPYWLWRGILPKLLRGEWDRLRAALRGYADFVRGRQSAPAATTGTAPRHRPEG